MKTMKKTAAAGIALAATAGLVAGPVMMTGQAWADDIKITMTDTVNKGVAYNAYEIFSADVNGSNASNIKWATGVNQETQAKILEILGITDTGANSAQAAADAMAKLGITDDSELPAGSKMTQIAAYVSENVTPIAFTEGAATVTETGYYLVLGTADAGSTDVATTPIFALVDADGVGITPKVDVPTVEKKVTNDGATTPGDVANAEIGEALTFTLSSSLPTNLASYDTYEFKFVDTYATDAENKAIFNAPTDVVVTVGGQTVSAETDGVTISATDTGLVVTFTNIKDIDGAAAGAEVVVTYKASLTENAKMNTIGSNDNTVYIEYSNDPMSTGKGQSKPDDAKVYSYALKIEKQDAVSNTTINGTTEGMQAIFTFQECDDSGTPLANAKVFEVKTDATGMAEVKGLDAGKYLVTETKSPDGYAKADPFILTVTASEDLSKVTFTEDAPILAEIKETDGVQHLVVKDTPNPLNLPVTGMEGVYMLAGVGGVLVLTAVGGFALNRRKSNQED